MGKLWRSINLLASEICADYERSAPKSGPNLRPIARFSVAVTFLAILVLEVALISSRSSQVTTQRHFDDHKGLADLLSNKNATCPCAGNVYIVWTDHVSFYMLNRTDSGSQESVLLTDNGMQSFCSKLGMQTESDACFSGMQYCFGNRTPKSLSQQLVIPAVFSEMLISGVQGKCSDKLLYFKLLLRTEAITNKTASSVGKCSDECIYEPLMRSLFSVLQAFKENPYNTSDEYYWDAPSRIYPNATTLMLTKDIAFKMAANYTSYLQACDPRYCDLVTYVKLWRRIITALAQLGGVLTIALAGLRLLIWPSLVWLFALDEKPTCFADRSIPNS